MSELNHDEIKKPTPDSNWSEKLKLASELTSAASDWLPGKAKEAGKTTSKIFGMAGNVAEHKENKESSSKKDIAETVFGDEGEKKTKL